jgi:hypothetical protein
MEFSKDSFEIGLSKAHANDISADFYVVQIGDLERWDVYLTETDELIGSSETLRGVPAVVDDWLRSQA